MLVNVATDDVAIVPCFLNLTATMHMRNVRISYSRYNWRDCMYFTTANTYDLAFTSLNASYHSMYE